MATKKLGLSKTVSPTHKNSSQLRKRLQEMNALAEKEMASILENIEKAKAAFRASKVKL